MSHSMRWGDIKRRPADPASQARMDEYRRAMRDALALGELREARGATQVAVAGAAGVVQANVSRIERQDNLYLSTLREYVEALGGRLQIAAVFPDQTILLTPPGGEAPDGEPIPPGVTGTGQAEHAPRSATGTITGVMDGATGAGSFSGSAGGAERVETGSDEVGSRRPTADAGGDVEPVSTEPSARRP